MGPKMFSVLLNKSWYLGFIVENKILGNPKTFTFDVMQLFYWWRTKECLCRSVQPKQCISEKTL